MLYRDTLRASVQSKVLWFGWTGAVQLKTSRCTTEKLVLTFYSRVQPPPRSLNVHIWICTDIPELVCTLPCMAWKPWYVRQKWVSTCILYVLAAILPGVLHSQLVQQVVDGATAGGQSVSQLVVGQLVTEIVIVRHTRRRVDQWRSSLPHMQGEQADGVQEIM